MTHELPVNPALTAEGLLRVRWHVIVDDVIGGWSLSNVNLPASVQDPNRGDRYLAEFVFREHAAYVAKLHEAERRRRGYLP